MKVLKAGSKYDFVKVRVNLSESHYYILSRFLISRVLMATGVEASHAVRIALNLKKMLVDGGLLELTQAQLEERLFDLMQNEYSSHYGPTNVHYYRLFSRFHHMRIPLILVISGTACVRKSTLSSKLAERLNLPNVVNTDLIHEMIQLMQHNDDDASQNRVSLPWLPSENGEDQDLTEIYRQNCRAVSLGLTAELSKCFSEGKSLILEGVHIDNQLLQLLSSLSDPKISGTHAPIINLFHLSWESDSLHRQHILHCFGHMARDADARNDICHRVSRLNDLMMKERRGTFSFVHVDNFALALDEIHQKTLKSLDNLDF